VESEWETVGREKRVGGWRREERVWELLEGEERGRNKKSGPNRRYRRHNRCCSAGFIRDV